MTRTAPPTRVNRCPNPRHTQRTKATCDACRAYYRWARQMRNAGHPLLTSAVPVRNHVLWLLAQHLTLAEIAGLAGMTGKGLDNVVRNRRAGNGRKGTRILAENAERVLAVRPDGIPLDRRTWVDSTGVRRMCGAMSLRGLGQLFVADRIGCHQTTVSHWLRSVRVSGSVAAQIRDLYAATITVVAAPCTATTIVMKRARAAGMLPDRYWPPDTIWDPSFQPLELIPDPVGVRRRLRALARDGHGPDDLGVLLGETGDVVAGWTGDAPVPRYAYHLVVGVYDRLAGRVVIDTATGMLVPAVGGDDGARGRAVAAGWAGWADWDDETIDLPAATPVTSPEWNRRKTDVDAGYVAGALSGQVPRRELTQAELIEVVRRLAKTRTSREIGDLLRWSSTSDLSQVAVSSFASAHGIPLVASQDRVFSLGPKYTPKAA